MSERDFRSFLERCVVEAVGTHAAARPGQVSLAERITAAFDKKTHTLDLAPTGTGKSIAALSAAAWAALERGERTVISSHNLGLLEQYVAKDAAPVQRAVAAYGGRLDVAALKGVGNYIDPRRLLASVATLLGDIAVTLPVNLDQLSTRLDQATIDDNDLNRLATDVGVHEPLDRDRLLGLLEWALSVLDDDSASGDRQSCPVSITNAEWMCVSAPSEVAAGTAQEGFGFTPKAVAAKERAAAADILVTNHTLVGIQAARAVPVILGSTSMGVFDNIVIDEAHMLPSIVRGQGASSISGSRINRLGRQLSKATDGADSVRRWRRRGETLADNVDEQLRRTFDTLRHGRPVATLSENDHPFDEALESELHEWVAAGARLLKQHKKSSTTTDEIRHRRAAAALETLERSATDTCRHRVGVARWVEIDNFADRGEARVSVTPVDVGGMLNRNIWHRERTDNDLNSFGEREALPVVQFGARDLVPMGVACMSATLPQGFEIETRLNSALCVHESPFGNAYSKSMLYVPGLTEPELPAVAVKGGRGKWRFQTTSMHPEFVRQQSLQLIRANQGHALVLTAKSSDGRELASWLRERVDVAVYSQWDGLGVDQVKQAWIDDESSVLVGTKSLMTGVDAPGETCSLVIIDRPPRAASNPESDARVEALQERLQVDRWTADRLVYVADAMTEMQQAAGRLIRRESDSGMVAVLDPRLIKGCGVAYPEPTRLFYLEAFSSFTNRVMMLGDAVRWLEQRRGLCEIRQAA